MSTPCALPHRKTRDVDGGHLLEPCEDAGCTVGPDGHASCGRLACPRCGFSGSNLTGLDADPLRCAICRRTAGAAQRRPIAATQLVHV